MNATPAFRRQQIVILATILIANFVIACMIYETVGWFYIRGYREVTTFLVYPVILIQAAANLVLCAILGIANRWQQSKTLHTVVLGHLVSSLMVAASLPIAPVVGSMLKYNLVLHTSIVDAAAYQDGELVKKLLLRGVDPNTRGRPGLNATALHYMAASSDTEVVELLLKKGADPNARAHTLHTLPLHGAVFYRAPRTTILALLKYGADPKLRDHEGRTALDYAQGIPEPQGSWLRGTMSGLPYDPLPHDAAQPAHPRVP